ncbi:hypothetical protein AVEN_92266-1 [Araneus ventricosus]|uniref:Uncharacterized protein n=1 Tax=Araneus ventricosus TaxID=182803 RepID=A0A4Y2AM87_ARAVE|nr:hypothetical protein AVEN_92266-1 [Araneus ventricosus]
MSIDIGSVGLKEVVGLKDYFANDCRFARGNKTMIPGFGRSWTITERGISTNLNGNHIQSELLGYSNQAFIIFVVISWIVKKDSLALASLWISCGMLFIYSYTS